MSNYIEVNDKIAFHPGYYIKELIDELGLTQEDFAKRLGTTPKNLSLLIRGEQRLSIDIAAKLSRLIGTSVEYWLNLQKNYDALLAECVLAQELEEEREVFKALDYKYFRDNYGLPDLPRQTDKQIEAVRDFLKVSSLSVIAKYDMTVSFRAATGTAMQANTIRANAMVQIAINRALETEAPKYNRQAFEKAIEYALTLTRNHEEFYPLLKESFNEAGVVFVIMPNHKGSKINGATKKLGNKIMLMVNDRRLNSDTFWFTLFHEIGHILNGDFGMTLEEDDNNAEEEANNYAENKLIPYEEYRRFVNSTRRISTRDICEFAEQIDRDPGIVLGRLQNDGIISFKDRSYDELRHRYKVVNVKA